MPTFLFCSSCLQLFDAISLGEAAVWGCSVCLCACVALSNF
ncbi:hypothetical protein CP082626L3_1449 [Chlamydia psittaci 08-2626_L3]|nr:hypothetical protein CP082626L3_1449 [Chlamydia psittaci 08-2626_L3]